MRFLRTKSFYANALLLKEAKVAVEFIIQYREVFFASQLDGGLLECSKASLIPM